MENLLGLIVMNKVNMHVYFTKPDCNHILIDQTITCVNLIAYYLLLNPIQHLSSKLKFKRYRKKRQYIRSTGDRIGNRQVVWKLSLLAIGPLFVPFFYVIYYVCYLLFCVNKELLYCKTNIELQNENVSYFVTRYSNNKILSRKLQVSNRLHPPQILNVLPPTH